MAGFVRVAGRLLRATRATLRGSREMSRCVVWVVVVGAAESLAIAAHVIHESGCRVDSIRRVLTSYHHHATTTTTKMPLAISDRS